MRYFISAIFTLFLASTIQSQEQIQDSTSLDEVVITAQLEPQSLKKSVFNVTRISRKDILQQAANNLADVLNQYLNITITPSSGTGRSTTQLFGLDGRYFKILVDNIPIVTDGGLGNNTDLTQINLDDIEQIEIIEGSMGVSHGANAVTGILNIITKKSIKNDWEISVTAQEETVGSEYKPFSKGRHIQAAKISHRINDNWFASIGVNRNDFDGFLDSKKGPDYEQADFKRGYTWLPKEQVITNGLIRYEKSNLRIFYKFDYLDETIDFYNSTILSIANPPFGNRNYAEDRRYLSHRFYNHLNISGKTNNELAYNVSVSYQNQARRTENFEYDFTSGNESDNEKVKNQQSEIWFSTGTISNFFRNKKVDLQLGYELSSNLGESIVDGENQTQNTIEKTISNYDLFVVSEINLTSKFSVRPGLRWSIQSVFEDQYASSLGLRYLLNNGYELRASMGKSFRTPEFDELYSKIKFSGHQFYGNEDLVPETSSSYDLSVKRTANYKSGFRVSQTLSAAFLDVDDRIDMAFVGFEADTSPIYQYINVSDYYMINGALTNQFAYKNLTVSIGASIVGISQKINNGSTVSDDKYLFSLQTNAALSYNFPKQNAVVSVYFKYNGDQQQFVETIENGSNVFKISKIESYSFLDASIRKSFFNKRFDVTIGARNLLDITRINQGIATGGQHTSTNELLLGYGRSYFIKLMYNLNF